MRRLLSIIAALVAVMLLCPATSHAASITIDINDTNTEIPFCGTNPNQNYAPAYVGARSITRSAGDVIKWDDKDALSNYKDCGTGEFLANSHSVTSYYPGASGAVLNSPTLSTATCTDCTPVTSYTKTYGGGTVLYRCLYMSSLDTLNGALNPPACIGMCGAIQDSSPDAAHPSVSITTAPGFVFTGGVRIDGTASDNRAVTKVRVSIKPLSGLADAAPVFVTQTGYSTADDTSNVCYGCYGPLTQWIFRKLPDVKTGPPAIVLPPGAYLVEAQAQDSANPPNFSAVATITIYVSGVPDTVNRGVATVVKVLGG